MGLISIITILIPPPLPRPQPRCVKKVMQGSEAGLSMRPFTKLSSSTQLKGLCYQNKGEVALGPDQAF